MFGPIPIEAFRSYKIIDSLGHGIYGEAFLTGNDQVLKITSEKGEHLWAKEMIGHKCTHVVDVYDTWEYTWNKEQIFFICEEKIDTNAIDYDTRHNVYTILNYVLYNLGEQCYRSRTELSKLLAKDDNKTFEANARTIFLKYPKEENLLNSLLDAYIESLHINPKIELDLSAFNFGISCDGIIKVFDCSLPEKTKYRIQNTELKSTFSFNIIPQITYNDKHKYISWKQQTKE